MSHPLQRVFIVATPLLLTGILGASVATAGDTAAAAGGDRGCPLHAAHVAEAGGAGIAAAEHRRALDARGDQHMGFRQEATVHHFRVAEDGGAIEVTARDAGDAATIAQVRAHLSSIRDAFAAGDFAIPEAVHARVPAGVPALQAAGGRVAYRYEELPAGARVVLAGADDGARQAIHEFLRFQIADHGTGDPHDAAASPH